MADSALNAHMARQRLRSLGSPEHASILARFFKTGPGQYGEGDRFIGIKVPVIRKVAKELGHMPLPEVERLLHSEIHEERLLALIILVAPVREGRRNDQANRLPALLRQSPVDQQLGSRRPFFAANRRRIPGNPQPKTAPAPGKVIDTLAAADRHCVDTRLHSPGRFRRYADDCRNAPGRQARPHPQSGRLDAAGSRQTQHSNLGGIPQAIRSSHA